MIWQSEKNSIDDNINKHRAINVFTKTKKVVRMLVNPKKANILWQLHLPRYPFMDKDDFFYLLMKKDDFFNQRLRKIQ